MPREPDFTIQDTPYGPHSLLRIHVFMDASVYTTFQELEHLPPGFELRNNDKPRIGLKAADQVNRRKRLVPRQIGDLGIEENKVEPAVSSNFLDSRLEITRLVCLNRIRRATQYFR